MEERVMLVDKNDVVTGTMEKLEAHRQGLLHRAISVFIFNSKGELLLQQRDENKYHSGGLWTNTCCSHPRPGEETMQAAERRLSEEMGLRVPLTFKCTFIYKALFDNGLTEHELDHVFTGETDEDPVLNREEAMNFRWEAPDTLRVKIRTEPEKYTYWFRHAMLNLF